MVGAVDRNTTIAQDRNCQWVGKLDELAAGKILRSAQNDTLQLSSWILRPYSG